MRLQIRTITLTLLLLALVSLPLLAQDDGENSADDATETSDATEEVADVLNGSAPEILSLEPETLTISGGVGVGEVLVSFDDIDGDATTFVWSMVDTNLTSYVLPVGLFNQLISGTEIPVAFACGAPGTYADMELVVQDVYGNESEAASFSLVCAEADSSETGVAEAETSSTADVDTAADETAALLGSAPEIVSISPDPAVIAGAGEIAVTVVYADADEDATRFTWTLIDSANLLSYELPGGTFTQSVVGTEITVNFFCTNPDFRAEIALVVSDAMGNESDPASFELVCE